MFERIAFLKLCCPGDLLFTTPAVRAVKNRFPDARLIYLTGNYSSFVAGHNPHIAETLIVPPPFEMRGLARSARAFWMGMKILARSHFDLVISFHRSMAVATMARLGRAHEVISFDTAGSAAHRSVVFDAQRHEVWRYLNLVSLLDAKPIGLELQYQITAHEDSEAEKFLAAHKISSSFAVIAPGGGENPGTIMHIKRWPAPRFKEVAQYLRKSGLQVVEVGSESEQKLDIGADVNLAGKTTFPQLAAILKRASLVIANDSGPLYLASAVRAKTIGIYGPSSPDLVAPFGEIHRSVGNRLCCQPCYHPGRNVRGTIECPQGNWACMLTVQVDDVISAINNLLAAA